MIEKSKPIKIEALIQATLKEFGKKRIKYKNLLLEIQKTWTALVGDLIAANTQVVRISKNKLIIHTANSTWLHELIYHRADLQSKIQKSFPDTEGLSIIFKVGNIQKDGQTSSEDGGENDNPSMEGAFPHPSDEDHQSEGREISSS